MRPTNLERGILGDESRVNRSGKEESRDQLIHGVHPRTTDTPLSSSLMSFIVTRTVTPRGSPETSSLGFISGDISSLLCILVFLFSAVSRAHPLDT